MPADFKWQTEEETDWTDELAAAGGTAVPLSKRKWFRPLLIASLMVILAGSIVFWQLTQRAEAAASAIEADIMASHEVWVDAVMHSDADLFHAQRQEKGGAYKWRQALDSLFEEGLLFDRSMIGFIAETAVPHPTDIILSPDLESAQLIAEQPFALRMSTGATQTVTLRYTYFYQHEDDRWLLAPPDDDFWGEWRQYDGQNLILHYSVRDEVVALRVATDLNEQLGQLCNWFSNSAAISLTCQDDLLIQVRLSRDLGSLSWSNDLSGFSMPDSVAVTHTVNLPSPTLIGEPTDEAGIEALADFYLFRMLAAIFRGLIQGQNLATWYPTLQYREALLMRQSAQWGVRPWPLPIAQSDTTPPPIPWPEQKVALACLDGESEVPHLRFYDPARAAWSTEPIEPGLVSLQSLPDGDGLLAQYVSDDEAVQSWTIRWTNGDRISIPPVPDYDLSLGRVGVNGRYLVGYIYGDGGPASHVYALEPDQCHQAACEWQELPGSPVWSPVDSQLLLHDWDTDQLWRWDNDTEDYIALGTGINPFWLNEEIYGYSTFTRGDEQIVIASISDDLPQPLFTDDLQAILPDDVVDDSFYVYTVRSSPTNPDLLLISVSMNNYLEKPIRLFFLNRRTNEIVWQLTSKSYPWAEFAAGGLVWRIYDDQRAAWSLYRYDIVRDQTETLLTAGNPYSITPFSPELSEYEWSVDGQWLLILHDGVLILLAPAYNYKQVIIPDAPGCFNAVWVNS